MTNWFETRNGASGLSSQFEEDPGAPGPGRKYERPGFRRATGPHRRGPLRNPDSREEVLAAWLTILGRVTVSIGGRFATLGTGDILK
jgi:hypothetical protein